MSNLLFWNVIGLGAVLILLMLFFTIRRGSHRVDQAGNIETTTQVITLLVAFIIFVIVSLTTFWLFG